MSNSQSPSEVTRHIQLEQTSRFKSSQCLPDVRRETSQFHDHTEISTPSLTTGAFNLCHLHNGLEKEFLPEGQGRVRQLVTSWISRHTGPEPAPDGFPLPWDWEMGREGAPRAPRAGQSRGA